jgi:hypothetical protein
MARKIAPGIWCKPVEEMYLTECRPRNGQFYKHLKRRSIAMRLARMFSWSLFAAVAGLAIQDQTVFAQNSRQQTPKQRSGQNQDSEKKDDEAAAKFRVLLKDATTHLAIKTETRRNGNVVVTLVDGKTVTILKKDLDKIEEITSPTEQPRQPPGNRSDRGSSGRRNSRNQQGSQSGDNSNSSGQRPRPGEKSSGQSPTNPKSNPGGITPRPVSSVTLALANGTNLTATSVRQTRNGQWQATLPNGQRRNVDPSRIGSIKSPEGEFLTSVVGPNGEITWTIGKPGNGNPGTTPPPATPGVEQTFFNTLTATAKQPPSSSSIRQVFLAAGNFLETVEIKVDSSHSLELKLTDLASQQVLGEQVVTTTPGGITKFTFSPALPVVAGNRYRAEFRIPNLNPSAGISVIKAYVTTNEEYVFSGAQKLFRGEWVRFDDDRSDLDLVMRVSGRRPAGNASAVPTKRALLVLLENDGIVSSLNAAAIDYPDLPDVQYMVFTGEGGIEFKLNKNESVAQAIARVSAQLTAFAQSRVGPMPQPPKFSGISNPTDPNYLTELNAWQSSVQALIHTLSIANNWQVRTESADTFIDAVSDLVIEKFTSTWILQKTVGKYDKVVVLEDAQFGATNVLAKLKELSTNHVIDIHVLSHGGINVINGASNAVEKDLKRDNFFVPLQQGRLSGEIPLRLRAVYQCNCVGGTLKREWLGVGAQVVGGTVGENPGNAKNNYMPQQYLHFLDYWCDQNKTMQQALNASFDDAANYSQGVYSALSDDPDLIEDSRLTVSGDGSVKRN